MTSKIYASTSCLWSPDLDYGIPKLFGAGFDGVELSASRWYADIHERVGRWREWGPLSVHNYFPRPRRDFVFNLASRNSDIVARSSDHAKFAINLAAAHAIGWVSFHSGFRLDPRPEELGNPLEPAPLVDRSVSLEGFTHQAIEISNYGAEHGVRVLWENNVLSAKNYQTFGENPLLVVTSDEIRSLQRQLPKNSGILLDVAHLSVSCRVLGLNRIDALMELEGVYSGLHLSDDSGETDDGALITESSWFWQGLSSNVDYIVVESHFLDADSAEGQAKLVKHLLASRQKISSSGSQKSTGAEYE